ncbi:MAG: alanine--tRNA ligase [Bacteriovoracaceae bacterium]|nr:alanine--tRNA ligase [Bacteriovoracaceae bacterium]
MRNLSAHEIRQSFSHFFIKNGHQKIASSSLVPHQDPTLLFNNAGMNQFKDYFVGKKKPTHPTAVTIQKCVRAGGKHNDLENVGFTARHHTFFEMLGNFSFGDYFKVAAIEFAWQWLTQELSIPKDKLFVTVHKNDEEALKIWNNHMGLPLSRIFKRDDKDNFWEMGDVGPCGPCSEIFYDHGEKYTTPNAATPIDDERRLVEIWNLVFMQFEETGKGRISLPKPSVDTGAGLERITAVLQGKYWNYDTDLFLPIIKKIETISGKEYANSQYTSAMRVIADHARACSMLITDGVLPSNEGRGYVLRRIIRRAIRYLNDLNIKDLSFYKLVPEVFTILGEEYAENKAGADLAEKILKLEEKKFLETLDQGLKFLHENIKNPQLIKNGILSGESVFKLYDTYGFPADLTQTILKDKNLSFDQKDFEQAMLKQKELSKKSWKGSFDLHSKSILEQKSYPATLFEGYEKNKMTATLLGKISQENKNFLIFDKTPFYAEGGGQVGEKGEILLDSTKLVSIESTAMLDHGVYVHQTSDDISLLEEGQLYTLQVDSLKRDLSARNHSATHLLQSALIKVLGNHVKQSGSFVTEDKLRFDFTHHEALTIEQKKQVEDLVNDQIAKKLLVCPHFLSKEEALKKGAMALFGEKYSEQVRVIQMGEDTKAFSLELCGGIHVKNTSDIALFILTSETALASGIRRIEAITSLKAFEYLKENLKISEAIAQKLQVTPNKLSEKIEAVLLELKNKERTVNELQDKINVLESKDLFQNPETLKNGVLFKATSVSHDKDLKKISDLFIQKNPQGVILLYQIQETGKMAILLRKGNTLPHLSCADLLKNTLPILEGKGGGKADMAQGSGENKQKIEDFLNKVRELLEV